MPNDKPAEAELSQLEKFKNAARELECDDDPEVFKKRLGKLAKAKPPEKKPTKQPRGDQTA
ncbi:MAG: hypothetical protein VX569_01360 [Pseudomonadota bacterium]|nr:hypothetical protein [Pseudomonadota bacterium]